MTYAPDNPKLRLARETDVSSPSPDPALEAALDQVLAPEALEGGIPAELENKILEQTLPLLRRRQSVIAVFRHLPWAGRIAAMLYFAGLLGIGFTGASIVHDAGTQVFLKRDLPLAVAKLSQAAEQVPQRLASVNQSIHSLDSTSLLTDWQSLETGLELELRKLEQAGSAASGMNL